MGARALRNKMTNQVNNTCGIMEEAMKLNLFLEFNTLGRIYHGEECSHEDKARYHLYSGAVGMILLDPIKGDRPNDLPYDDMIRWNFVELDLKEAYILSGAPYAECMISMDLFKWSFIPRDLWYKIIRICDDDIEEDSDCILCNDTPGQICINKDIYLPCPCST